MIKDEEIAFCLEQRERAERSLKWVGKGARFFRGTGSGPLTDLTDKHKEVDEKQVAYWTRRLELLGSTDT